MEQQSIMNSGLHRLGMTVGMLAVLTSFSRIAAAELYINEIFIDPPGSEAPREYVELRGAPGISLDNLWFIVLENENTLEGAGNPGSIDLAIDLSGYSVGSNGFVAMRRAANSPYVVDPLATVIELPTTLFENSGGTYMLIDRGAGPAPIGGMALDGNVDNDDDPLTIHDGLDYPGEGQPGWTILDAIGVFVEGNEAGLGRLYAPINFGPEKDGQEILPDFGGPIFHAADHIEPGAIYVGTGFEIELIARYGNSTGQTEKDWHATNVTDNVLAGYSTGNFAQAGSDPHGYPRPAGDPNTGVFESESGQYIPYGTIMTNTIGSANYPLNQSSLPWDYNQNGTVDAADYTIWRDTLGTPDPTGKSQIANADRDGSVDQTDYDAWKWHFGESLPTMMGAGAVAVPEPASWLLVACGLAAAAVRPRRRQA